MEVLRKLRKERGITTTELGVAVGCTNPTITNYELGYRQPDNEMLLKLADYFDVSVDYLLGREERKDLIKRPAYDITDQKLVDFMKLYEVMTEIQKAQVLGYVIGLLENAGVNVKTVLGY